MTNAQQKAIAAERYPELSAADARKALRQDLRAEREHNDVISQYQRYQEQCRKDAGDVARIERDLDMAGIAQTPRRRVLMTGNAGLMSIGILAGKPTGG